MNEPRRGWTDQQVEQFLGNLLRYGVIVAAAVVLVGGVLFLIQEATTVPDYEQFHGEPREMRTVGGIVADAFHLHGRGVIQFGVLLLIAVPVARVAFSVVAFALEGDYFYMGITLIVLAVLLFSLFGGRLLFPRPSKDQERTGAGLYYASSSRNIGGMDAPAAAME